MPRSPIRIDLHVQAGAWPPKPVLRRLVGRAVKAAAAAAAAGSMAPEPEVALVFTDDGRMQELNARFRAKDAPTNVLSFPAGPAAGGRHGPLLGDVFLGQETVAKEAQNLGLTFEAHLTHLIVHGFLHLLGYDHVDDADAMVMEGAETAILASLGISDPYAIGDRAEN